MKGSIAEGKILGKTGTLGKMANLVGIIQTNTGDEPFVILGEGTHTAQTRGRIDQALIKTTEYIERPYLTWIRFLCLGLWHY
jgi:D-alanyl-D-alanine carboxypeptidase